MTSAPSGNKGDRIKLVAAIGALSVAGVLIAWQLGLLDSLFRSKPPAQSPAEQAAVEKMMKQAEEQAKITPPS